MIHALSQRPSGGKILRNGRTSQLDPLIQNWAKGCKNGSLAH